MLCVTFKNWEGRDCLFYKKENGKNKIMTFENTHNAQKGIDYFQSYAIMETRQTMNDIFGLGNIIQFCSTLQIQELSPSVKEEDTISFERLMKDKGYEI